MLGCIFIFEDRRTDGQTHAPDNYNDQRHRPTALIWIKKLNKLKSIERPSVGRGVQFMKCYKDLSNFVRDNIEQYHY